MNEYSIEYKLDDDIEEVPASKRLRADEPGAKRVEEYL